MKTRTILFTMIASLAVAVGFSISSCDAGGDASCSVCNHSFTTAECSQLAQARGCASGEAYDDTVCKPATRGCKFTGCPVGRIECTFAADGGKTD
jgi:hypothetical protein